MTDRSPTPDLLPRFQRKRYLDHAPKGASCRNDADIVKGATDIKRSPAGRKSEMDSNKSTGGKHFQSSLGAEESGMSTHLPQARAPKANWSILKRG